MSRYSAHKRIDVTAPIDQLPALLTVAQAAKYLQVARRTIARWEQLGLIKMVRVAGGYPRLPRAEIERLLREGGGRATGSSSRCPCSTG